MPTAHSPAATPIAAWPAIQMERSCTQRPSPSPNAAWILSTTPLYASNTPTP